MKPLQIAARHVLSNYATFSGRATRYEFWWWVLAVLLTLLVCGLIDALLLAPLLGFEVGEDAAQPLSSVVSLGLLIPNIAVAMRRLHDMGRAGWWLLIGLVPIVGALVLLYFYVQPSEPGDNQYGPPAPQLG